MKDRDAPVNLEQNNRLMKSLNRRTFLKGSLLAAASCGLGGWPSLRAAGANDTLNFAVVGFRGQGGDHLNSLRRLQEAGEKVRIVALCDADRDVLAAGVKQCRDRGETVTGYLDIRQLLENKAVDAVSIASPNHWHALMTIWACQAGKDVFVEKPVSHNVLEGRRMVEAARKYRRIVQTGTQSRSSQGIAEAVEWVRAGNLGRIQIARGLCYKRRASIGRVNGPQAIPESIDYNLWCGPAPLDPLTRRQLHYDWHWVWPTGNGDLGNQGIHQMDIARWFLGESELAPRVMSIGGRLGYVDDATTPNTQIVWHGYTRAPLIFEVRGLPEKTGSNRMDQFLGGGVAVIIHCEHGHVLVPNYNSAIAYDREGAEIQRWQGARSHHANFIQAVWSRKSSDLTADILEGHLSSALCHTGNISYLLGRKMPPQEATERAWSQPDGQATFDRMLAHLRANEVSLDFEQLTVGVPLVMNPRREVFVDNDAANELLTRVYRRPFVVPERV